MIINAEQIWSEAYLTKLKACLSSNFDPTSAIQRAKESADEALRVWRGRIEEIRTESKTKHNEIERLTKWLIRIEGGDTPCTDERQLRQWAYEALTLGRNAE